MIHQLTQPLAKTQEHPGSQIGPRGKNRLAALKPEPKGRSIPDHLFDNDITIDFFRVGKFMEVSLTLRCSRPTDW